LRDGEYIRVPITLMDAATIKAVRDGKREISMGYDMELDWTPGATSDGQAYDAVMTNLRMNHLAIVDRGRAGSRARIGDKSPWGVAPLNTDDRKPPIMTTRKIVVDGLTIETTDQGAEAIGKLQAEKQTISDARDAAIAAKDAELAAKDARIADLENSQLTAEALDAKVQARADLLAKAKALAKDADFTGKADLEIMKAAVIAVRGADSVKDKSDAYVTAAFDLAVESKPDAFRTAMKDRKPPENGNGQTDYEKRLNDAWKGSAK
jgi:hypothetical protein